MMNEQDRQAFKQNWTKIKGQLQSQFPNLSEDDLGDDQGDPDRLAERIAERTGQDRELVSQQINQLVQQTRQV